MFDMRVALGEAMSDFGGAIRATIIDYNQFEIAVQFLQGPQPVVHDAGQRGRLIERRQDYADRFVRDAGTFVHENSVRSPQRKQGADSSPCLRGGLPMG